MGEVLEVCGDLAPGTAGLRHQREAARSPSSNQPAPGRRRELIRQVIHLHFDDNGCAADPASDPLELAEVTAVLDELTCAPHPALT